MNIIFVDGIILGVLLISLMIGLFRGFLKEAISLGVWIGGTWLALHFYPQFSHAFPGNSELLRSGLAFVTILLTIIIVGMVVSKILSLLIYKIGLNNFDRLAGAIFGLVRGMLLVVLTVLIIEYCGFGRSLHSSKLVPFIQPFVTKLRIKMVERDWKELKLLEVPEFEEGRRLNDKVHQVVEQISHTQGFIEK